jgi:antitoxin component YwqK of YwqJK toxin-antitoxin module
MKPELKEQFYPNGSLEHQAWFLNGYFHNEEGPAFISYHENGNIEKQVWCFNGKYHNEDGPADIGYYEDGKIRYQEWWINDKQLLKRDFTSLDMIKRMDAFDFFSAIEIARFKI